MTAAPKGRIDAEARRGSAGTRARIGGWPARPRGRSARHLPSGYRTSPWRYPQTTLTFPTPIILECRDSAGVMGVLTSTTGTKPSVSNSRPSPPANTVRDVGGPRAMTARHGSRVGGGLAYATYKPDANEGLRVCQGVRAERKRVDDPAGRCATCGHLHAMSGGHDCRVIRGTDVGRPARPESPRRLSW
jgi:hypothetical protein